MAFKFFHLQVPFKAIWRGFFWKFSELFWPQIGHFPPANRPIVGQIRPKVFLNCQKMRKKTRWADLGWDRQWEWNLNFWTMALRSGEPVRFERGSQRGGGPVNSFHNVIEGGFFFVSYIYIRLLSESILLLSKSICCLVNTYLCLVKLKFCLENQYLCLVNLYFCSVK